MSVEYKTKDETPDLYHILGLTADVCKEPNCNELVQKAYAKKAKICHPDKYRGRKDVNIKEIENLFELITGAYDIIRDEKQRKAYNHKLSLNKQSSGDYFKLKKGVGEYFDALGEHKEPTDQQKLTFKDQMKLLDSKHGYDSSIENVPIPKNEAKQKVNDMAKHRAIQDEELKPQRIFNDGVFDLKKFNAAFDQVHNREQGNIVPHNGIPSAWNDLGSIASYGDFEKDASHLYVESGDRFDTGRDIYSSVDFGGPVKQLNVDEVSKLRGADYVNGHDNLGDDYYKDIKHRLRDRQSATSNIESMKYGDFKREDMAGYGIFEQLGFVIDDRLALDVDDDDISKRYEKMMAERQKELLPGNVQGGKVASWKKDGSR